MGQADINQCPPGGHITISLLSALTGISDKPLNPKNGVYEPKKVALINEPRCIGCKLCIKACPVDCIVGAAKQMHTVIAVDCTGCKLCLPVCPTDCILVSPPASVEMDASHWPEFSQTQVDQARQATNQKIHRIARREAKRKQQKRTRERERMREEILQAVQRKAAVKNPFKVTIGSKGG